VSAAVSYSFAMVSTSFGFRRRTRASARQRTDAHSPARRRMRAPRDVRRRERAPSAAVLFLLRELGIHSRCSVSYLRSAEPKSTPSSWRVHGSGSSSRTTCGTRTRSSRCEPGEAYGIRVVEHREEDRGVVPARLKVQISNLAEHHLVNLIVDGGNVREADAIRNPGRIISAPMTSYTKLRGVLGSHCPPFRSVTTSNITVAAASRLDTATAKLVVEPTTLEWSAEHCRSSAGNKLHEL
jgi:hypothetical protein